MKGTYVKNILRQIQLQQQGTKGKHIDILLFISIILLSIFGLVMVYNTSISIGIRTFGDPYYFIRDQLVWFGVGMVTLCVLSRVHYRMWYSLAVPGMFATLLLLLAVFLPGIGVRLGGANRWINLGFFVLQPSELTKLSVILYLSAWLSTREKERFGAFMLFLGIIVGLVILQPDLGTSIILVCISLIMYFVSGAPLKQLLRLVPVVIGVVLLLIILAPYRLARLTTFLNPESDPLGASYQIRQATLALGLGGWTGAGLGQSRQKHAYLPEPNTDAIFAVIGEELGFVGGVILISGMLCIVYRGMTIARKTTDPFGRLLAVGIISWFGFQSAINIGAIVSIFPLTGVPLPLISYGGSSFIVLSSAFGILLNISRYKTEK